jgi:hypothetical protein
MLLLPWLLLLELAAVDTNVFCWWSRPAVSSLLSSQRRMDLPASDLYAVGAAVSKAWTRVIESHCYLGPLRYSAAVIASQ